MKNREQRIVYAGFRFKQWHVVLGGGYLLCEREITKGMIYAKRLKRNEKLCPLCKERKELNDVIRFRERAGLMPSPNSSARG